MEAVLVGAPGSWWPYGWQSSGRTPRGPVRRPHRRAIRALRCAIGPAPGRRGRRGTDPPAGHRGRPHRGRPGCARPALPRSARPLARCSDGAPDRTTRSARRQDLGFDGDIRKFIDDHLIGLHAVLLRGRVGWMRPARSRRPSRRSSLSWPNPRIPARWSSERRSMAASWNLARGSSAPVSCTSCAACPPDAAWW